MKLSYFFFGFVLYWRKRVMQPGSVKGQGLVEYAMIIMLVAIVVIVVLALLGPPIGNVFSNVINNI
jgi:pilus assembly protein Flp/PilA